MGPPDLDDGPLHAAQLMSLPLLWGLLSSRWRDRSSGDAADCRTVFRPNNFVLLGDRITTSMRTYKSLHHAARADESAAVRRAAAIHSRRADEVARSQDARGASDAGHH